MADLRPNAGTASEAAKGLRWYEDGLGGEGLVEGTIRDARKMAARQPLSEDKVRRMPAWFARHEADLQSPANSDPNDDNYPGPGRVAWALWGGDAGRSWAERKVSQMDANPQRALEQPDEAEPVLDAPSWLKVLLADLVTFKFRAHGFHWNVAGPDFPQFHRLFKKVYELAESEIDPVAEQIRQLGPTSPFRLEEFIAQRSLDDSEQSSQEPVAMAADLQVRNVALIDTIYDAYYAAEQIDEPGLCNFLQNLIGDHKRLDWQLRMIVGQPLPEPPVDESPAGSSEDTGEAPDAPTDVPSEAAPARSNGSLTVEKRDGSTVQLRSATGAVRTVNIPEQRSMTAPITVDEDMKAEAPDGPPIFRGHAAVFDRESEDLGGFRETIARGAFRKALDANQDTVALFNHDPNYVLGRTTNNTLDLREDPRGLHAYFQAPDTQYARDLREVVRRGDVSQMSFAFTVAKDDWQERSDGSIMRRVLEVDRLYDVSLVTTPAYPQTDAQSVRDNDLAPESESTPEPSTDAAGTDEEAHEAREVLQPEQLAEAKRRLSLAKARENTPRRP